MTHTGPSEHGIQAGIDVTLPWPVGVTTNHMYERMGRRRRLTPRALAWMDEAIATMRTAGQRLPPPPWAVFIEASPPAQKRKRDLDNIIKVCLDSFRHAFGVEDTVDTIPYLVVKRERDREPGTIRVKVEHTAW